jgi:hypothetical protein
MNISQVLSAFSAYLSGKGSFRFGARTITLANTGANAVKFTFAVALAAIEHAALLAVTAGTVYPVNIIIGSTAVTIS